MSTQNKPTFTVELQGRPTLGVSFSAEYQNNRVAIVTFSATVNGEPSGQRQVEIEIGREFQIGLEFVRGTLTMSQQAEISFTGNIGTELGQFSIKDVIVAVNNS